MPQGHDIATAADRIEMTAVVLAPAGLPCVERIIARRIKELDARVEWRLRVAHDRLEAMAELAILARGDRREGDGEDDLVGAADAGGPRGLNTVFLYALPDSDRQRQQLVEAIARYLPSVCVVTFDAAGLEMLKCNAPHLSSRDRQSSNLQPEPVADDRDATGTDSADANADEVGELLAEHDEPAVESSEPAAESDFDRPLSISREEMDMLLQESAPAGGAWSNGGRS